MGLSRLRTILNSVVSDWRASARHGADTRSRFRLGMDFALSRFAGLLPKWQLNRVRQVDLRGGVKICYRLNKGDLHSIREIWFGEAYRLPFEDPSGVLLDLGANIGMTSLWLAKTYAFTQMIAVEPDPNNASLLRKNLELNGINCQVLEAAIGPKDGIARFEFSTSSNLGKLQENGGSQVPMISMETVCRTFALTKIGLVKIDIEGGEQELFDGPNQWLARAEAIIIEFHPTLVDYPRLIDVVRANGFKYIAANSRFPDNMDCFTREA